MGYMLALQVNRTEFKSPAVGIFNPRTGRGPKQRQAGPEVYWPVRKDSRFTEKLCLRNKVGNIRGRCVITSPDLHISIHVDMCTYTTHTNTDTSKYKY